MARQLGLHDHDDDRLTDIARMEHRTVAYWCGRRQEGNTASAWCYVCDTALGKWRSVFPMPAATRAAILRHRAEELARLRPTHKGLQETTP